MATGAKADGDEARLLRFPATNGTDVVFSYAGDLYTAPLTGGEARRLTSHVGYEIFPRFSPDGKTIAFTFRVSRPTARPLLSPANTTATVKSTSFLPRVANPGD